MIGLSTTGGCALYSIVQMAFMASGFAYMIVWIVTRGKLRKRWSAILATLFGFTPYIATYSVAMWKDPAFSISLVIVTLLLMDFVLSNGKVATANKLWMPSFITFLLFMIFSRNNGLYIVALLDIAVLALWLLSKRERSEKKAPARLGLLSGVLSALLVLSLTVTGPIYHVVGVASSGKAESFGILLNQMARVAAYDQNMTASDREYMDEILPLELYPTTYHPCSVDFLKWNPNFNSSALEHDFFSHWLSMLIRNPLTYLEAWELETCGFWTVNQPVVNQHIGNISQGGVRNTVEQYRSEVTELGIFPKNKLGNDDLYSIFPQDEWSFPIGAIHWFLLYLTIYLFLFNKRRWLLSLVPSFGLFATLVLASPIWYWERYGAAEQFLIPFYALLFFALANANGKEEKPLRSRSIDNHLPQHLRYNVSSSKDETERYFRTNQQG